MTLAYLAPYAASRSLAPRAAARRAKQQRGPVRRRRLLYLEAAVGPARWWPTAARPERARRSIRGDASFWAGAGADVVGDAAAGALLLSRERGYLSNSGSRRPAFANAHSPERSRGAF
jgi:hypothetical protein